MCAFCLAKEVPSGLVNLVFDLEICDRCFGIDLKNRMGAKRGWTLEVHERKRLGGGIVFSAAMVKSPEVRAAFSLENTMTAVTRKLFGELQVGVEAFDEAVYVKTVTRKKTRELLWIFSARNAILEMLINGAETVSIDRGRVEAFVAGTQIDLPSNFRKTTMIDCCVLLNSLETMTEDRTAKVGPYR